MTINPNGTEAKDIALYFVKLTTNKVTPAIMAKTVNQAKNLLSSGYTKDEIIAAIDHVNAKGVKMFSLGYINTCINKVLFEIDKNKQDQTKANLKKAVQEMAKQEVAEVVIHESNNRSKLTRFGVGNKDKYNILFDE